MVSELKTLSVVCLEKKHCTNLKMCTKLNDVVSKFMDYKLPWVLQYLEQKKNGYWLSICACSYAKLSWKHLDYGPVLFLALLVE